MGLMDKVKKILFDEDEIEVPVKSDELPKREVKKETFPSRGSFINHHENTEVEEENPIKEVIVPKEKEEKPEELPQRRTFNFVDDEDFDYMPKREVKKEVEEPKPSSRYSMYNAYDEVKMRENTSNSSFHAGLQEDKDYKKLIKTEEKEKDKKPFKVTPVISPVYGYIDVDKKIVEPKKVEIKEEKTQIRNFGPVSYNSERISKTIQKEEKTEEVVIPEKIEVEDSFDDIKTSGIENEYLGNNNIEESFESTSELETINDADSKMLEEDNYEYTPQTIEESEEEKQENDKLEDTIETDLFNLIDSMYKDDEESGDEE